MNRTRKTVTRSEDVILLAKFVGGNDEDAFAQLVRKYEPLVWNICCRILHNRCDAEDAFQSTFLLLATKARRIRKPKSLSSWLYGVAFRTASSIRRQRQREMFPYEQTVDAKLTEDVLELVARKNESELVSAEIMLMKEKHRTPLLMFYFMGDSTSQIAKTLDLTVSAVEGRLRQARRVLRLQLRMRGIEFESYSALVLPILAVSPSLSYATINNVLAASMTKGIACLLSRFTFDLNQIGARLMLAKIAVSFGMVCVASVGLIHHGNFPGIGDQITQVEGCERPAVSTLPIKFVQDEDVDDSPDPSPHVHLIEIHNHLYGVWQTISGKFFAAPKTETLPRIEYQVYPKLEKLTAAQNVILDVDLHEWHLDASSVELHVELEPLELEKVKEHNASLHLHLDATQQRLPSSKIMQTRVPFLSDLPVVGRLFDSHPKTRRLTIDRQADGTLLPGAKVETRDPKPEVKEYEK